MSLLLIVEMEAPVGADYTWQIDRGIDREGRRAGPLVLP